MYPTTRIEDDDFSGVREVLATTSDKDYLRLFPHRALQVISKTTNLSSAQHVPKSTFMNVLNRRISITSNTQQWFYMPPCTLN